VDDIDWSQYCVVRIAEYDAMKGEIELLQEARLHLRKLLDEFVDLCTEEQHTVEMLCLHRAAMKYDPWEYVQTYGRGLRQNEETAAGNAAQQQPMCVDNPAEGTAVDDIVTRMRTMDVDEYSDVLGVFSDAADEIERLRPRRLDLRRVSEWSDRQTKQDYDIVSQLRHPWEYDNLNFEVLCDYAADEIEALRKALHEARMQTALWRALCEEVQAELHDTVERSYRIEDERG
jgi:hypothetical protein